MLFTDKIEDVKTRLDLCDTKEKIIEFAIEYTDFIDKNRVNLSKDILHTNQENPSYDKAEGFISLAADIKTKGEKLIKDHYSYASFSKEIDKAIERIYKTNYKKKSCSPSITEMNLWGEMKSKPDMVIANPEPQPKESDVETIKKRI